MTDIKPCPFCGEADPDKFTFAALHRKWGNVECDSCGATGPPVHTYFETSDVWREFAIAEWNRRK